jgi:hypothetical protein
VKRACELIYTAERQASRDVGLAGLRLKPGSSHKALVINSEFGLYVRLLSVKVYIAVFTRELIKVVYLGLVLCVYSLCI